MSFRKLALSLILIIGITMLFCVNTYAYLDPSAMTYLIQAVAGVAIAGGAAIVIYWKKLKLFIKKRKRKGAGSGKDKAN